MPPLPKGWASKIGTSLNERELLRVVEFWWPKARPTHDGYTWLVYSVPEWQQKLPGQRSDKTVRRVISSLKARGILIAIRRLHPYIHRGGPVLWVRPNTDLIDRMLTGSRPNTDRILTETYIQTTDEHMNRETGLAGAPQASQPNAHQPEIEDMTKGADFLLNKKKQANVGSAMEAFSKGPRSASDWPSINSPTQAHEALCAACRAAGYTNPGSLTLKRSGQMKTMIRRMVMEGPAAFEEISTILFFVASKWPEFIGWAKSKYNVTVPGTAPNHDALTMYAVEAVGFWRSYEASNTVTEKPSAGSNFDDEL
jgi:hypothetical protein